MKQIFLLSFIFVIKAYAFIPPVTSILREIYDSRKMSEGVEMVFDHQVLNSEGGWSGVEEKLYIDKKGIRFLWKPTSGSLWTSGWLDKRSYNLGNEKKVASRSLLFLKNYTAGSALEFRDALINERFLKWDQLKQFKDGFELQGEPQTWDIKNNYVEHDSISLVLLPTGPSIAVMGLSEPNNKRVVYFDKGLLGLKKIEWVDGAESISWNFDGFSALIKECYFPKRATLVKDGRELIQSDLIAVRALNKRQATDWLQTWQKVGKGTGNTSISEETLKNLLSYR